MPDLAFEDFVPGTVTTYGRHAVTREEIVSFASQYDPQPMHLDEAAGAASILGGLGASGQRDGAGDVAGAAGAVGGDFEDGTLCDEASAF